MSDESLRRSLLLLVSVVAVACGSSKSNEPGAAKDGGASGSRAAQGAGGASSGVGGIGGVGGAGGVGAGGLPVGEILCGANTCSPIQDPSTESSACCTESGSCGLRLSFSSKCLSINMPGHTNPVCKPLKLAGIQFSGCCSPTGCGALITIAGIGCAENPDFGQTVVPCVFDTIGAGGPDASSQGR